MSQVIVVNASRTLFYCWSWDRWKSLRQLRRCFEEKCRRMYEPPGDHLRRRELGRAVSSEQQAVSSKQ